MFFWRHYQYYLLDFLSETVSYELPPTQKLDNFLFPANGNRLFISCGAVQFTGQYQRLPTSDLQLHKTCPTSPGFELLKKETAEAARCCDYAYRLDRHCRWCVVTLRPPSKVEDHRFQGIMWGEEEHTTSFIQADLENTIDTLKWPSYKGSAGGTAQQLTCFDRVGRFGEQEREGVGGGWGVHSLIVATTSLSSCTFVRA